MKIIIILLALTSTASAQGYYGPPTRGPNGQWQMGQIYSSPVSPITGYWPAPYIAQQPASRFSGERVYKYAHPAAAARHKNWHH